MWSQVGCCRNSPQIARVFVLSILTFLASRRSLQRSFRLKCGTTSGLTQVWSLLDRMVMCTLEYTVRFSSCAIWVICLCVRVPKKILGILFLLSLSCFLAASLVEAQGQQEQGSETWRGINTWRGFYFSVCCTWLLALSFGASTSFLFILWG